MYSEKTYNFAVPFDSLDVAIRNHAPISSWIRFVRKREQTGKVIYEMKTRLEGQVVTRVKGKSGIPVGYDWNGNMGEISLRDLGSVVRMIIVCDFPGQQGATGPCLQLDDVAVESLIEDQEQKINRLLHSLQQSGIMPTRSITEWDVANEIY